MDEENESDNNEWLIWNMVIDNNENSIIILMIMKWVMMIVLM